MSSTAPYQPFVLDLSPIQLQRSSQGYKIRLRHDQLRGGVSPDTLLLTPTQIAKIEKARASGKGCELQLSKAQLEWNVRYGSGRLSDYFRSVTNFVRDKALDGLSSAGSAVIKAGSKALGAAVKGLAPAQLPANVKSGLDSFVDMGIEAGGNWTTAQLEAFFLKGLRSTKTGSGVLGGSVQPVKLDLAAMLKKRSGLREPAPVLINRPSAPFYIQKLAPAIAGGRLYLPGKSGGAIYQPGTSSRPR